MLTAEKDLQQSLESSLAEANGLRSLVEHHTARTEEYEELLAVKDAEVCAPYSLLQAVLHIRDGCSCSIAIC